MNGVAVGGAFSCAVRKGRAYCWGANDEGLLGRGNTVDHAPTATKLVF